MKISINLPITIGILLVSMLSVIPSNAQEEPINNTDTSYIRLYPDTYTIRALLSYKFSDFRFTDKNLDREIDYNPNITYSLGLGTTIKGIGLNFSTAIPFIDKQDDRYGRTKRYDLQIHRYRRKLAMDIYLQRYKGFHLTEKDIVTQNPTSYEYTYFPQMRTFTYGVSAMYVFNGERFAMKPFVNQQEWQIKSAGSFLLGGSLFGHRITNDRNTLLPTYYKYPNFFDGKAINELNNYGLTLNAGYGYNLVFNKNWFLHGSFDVGAGPGYNKLLNIYGNSYENVCLNLKSNARLSLGYNSKTWYGGAFLIYATDRYTLPIENTKFSTNRGIFRVIVAKRFTSHRIDKKVK